MGRKLGITVGIGALVVAACTPARAETGRLADFSLGLGTTTPATPTAMTVHVAFHTAGSADAKSSPIRSVVLAGPTGMVIDSNAMPACPATDEQLRLLGTSACPAGSEAGAGSYSAILGFGAPLDPFTGDNHVFNADHQLIEVITFPGTGISPGFDRLTVSGGTLTAHPPVTPGGPPDGETATRSIDFAIPVHATATGSLITSPPACPETGFWDSAGTFGFADGRTETVVSRTPCDPAGPDAGTSVSRWASSG
jgi:hypothetical protein